MPTPSTSQPILTHDQARIKLVSLIADLQRQATYVLHAYGDTHGHEYFCDLRADAETLLRYHDAHTPR